MIYHSLFLYLKEAPSFTPIDCKYFSNNFVSFLILGYKDCKEVSPISS